MKFTSWMKKQRDRDDPVGELARYYVQLGEPKIFDFNYLKINGVSVHLLRAHRQATVEFQKQRVKYW